MEVSMGSDLDTKALRGEAVEVFKKSLIGVDVDALKIVLILIELEGAICEGKSKDTAKECAEYVCERINFLNDSKEE